ncbi:MAG: hypothetical protein PVF04_08160 [Anaerolineae bacterium]|jgi:hypothetical protein
MEVLRDLSVILLAVEAFIFALIPLALFGGLVYGVWKLRRHRNLPTWLGIARSYLMTALSYVELAMQAVTKPVFAVHRAFANVEVWIRTVTGREVDG